MENINNFSNTNLYKNNLFHRKKDLSKVDFRIKNEENFLSLRKKRNNRNINHLRNLNSENNEIFYNLNMNLIINYIKNEEIYQKYKSSYLDFDKLNYIIQMIKSKKYEMLKYGLIELRNYFLNIRHKNEFDSKNLLNFFDEKMVTYLFELLFKQISEFNDLEEYHQILILSCHILSELCEINESNAHILLKYLDNLFEALRKEENNNIKN